MLGKALYRRNRKKVEKVIPGSQTFSSNGTFVVPYETALIPLLLMLAQELVAMEEMEQMA